MITAVYSMKNLCITFWSDLIFNVYSTFFDRMPFHLPISGLDTRQINMDKPNKLLLVSNEHIMFRHCVVVKI